jgi:hypothetical protein
MNADRLSPLGFGLFNPDEDSGVIGKFLLQNSDSSLFKDTVYRDISGILLGILPYFLDIKTLCVERK